MKNQKELIQRIVASFFLLFIVEIGKHIPISFFISEHQPVGISLFRRFFL